MGVHAGIASYGAFPLFGGCIGSMIAGTTGFVVGALAFPIILGAEGVIKGFWCKITTTSEVYA